MTHSEILRYNCSHLEYLEEQIYTREILIVFTFTKYQVENKKTVRDRQLLMWAFCATLPFSVRTSFTFTHYTSDDRDFFLYLMI